MCISLFRVEICHQLVIFFNDLSVKKVDALLRLFCCKFYGMVCSVEVFYRFGKLFFAMGPN